MPAAPSQRRQITVRYGDTLELIAIRYFGSKAGINEIIQANPQLTNINQLRVGEMIYIPVGVPAKAASPDENTEYMVSFECRGVARSLSDLAGSLVRCDAGRAFGSHPPIWYIERSLVERPSSR